MSCISERLKITLSSTKCVRIINSCPFTYITWMLKSSFTLVKHFSNLALSYSIDYVENPKNCHSLSINCENNIMLCPVVKICKCSFLSSNQFWKIDCSRLYRTRSGRNGDFSPQIFSWWYLTKFYSNFYKITIVLFIEGLI